MLNLLARVVAVGFWAPGGTSRVGAGVLRVGLGLLLVLADVPGGFAEGEGGVVVASQEEGVGGTAGRVVARTDRFGCDGDETRKR